MAKEASSTNYVLGTETDEINRLSHQHQVWRKHCIDLWKRVGMGVGSKVIDIGAGPGFASLDLAELVGKEGRVAALERSQNFLSYLKRRKDESSLSQLSAHSVDLQKDEFGLEAFDYTWCRWVCSFLGDPRPLIENVRKSLRPGGIAIFHEYVNYDSWQMLPAEPAVTSFVRRVMATWKKVGCEANIAPAVARNLVDLNFEIREMTPLQFCAKPHEDYWRWVTDYMRVNTYQLLDRREISDETGQELLNVLETAEANNRSFMITPTVLEIIAVRA